MSDIFYSFLSLSPLSPSLPPSLSLSLSLPANDFTVNSSDSAISPISRDACITILITMDTDAENTEQFEVTLSSDDPSVDLQRTRAVVNILDDDDDTIIGKGGREG